MSITLATGKTALSAGQFLYGKINEYQLEKWRNFFNTILSNYRDGSCTAKEFENIIEQEIHSSMKARDAFIKLLTFSYRSLLDSVDDRVLPALARLTASYLEKLSAGNIAHIHAPVDPFFRGLCRLLSDLTGDEFEELQKLCQHFAKMPDSTAFLYLDYRPGRVNSNDERGTPNAGLCIHDVDINGGLTELHIGEFSYIERIAHLLIVNGFQTITDRASAYQSVYGKLLIWLDGALAKRIAKVAL